MLIRLVVTAGHHLGKVFEFTEHRTFLVGRAAETHLRFPDDDPFISRLHFLLEINPPELRLVDLGSTNGTKVNGQTVSSLRLSDGDVIEVGETKISVFTPDGRKRSPDRSEISPRATLVAKPVTPVRQESEETHADGDSRSQHAASEPRESPPGESSIRSRRATPKRIGDYVVERELGRGTFGVVYKVYDRGRPFALKLMQHQISAEEKFVRRFVRETKILEQLRHRCLVRFVKAGVFRKELFLVTEYVPGENLSQVMRRIGTLKTRSAVRIVRHLLLGLAHAHERGFVHRDIKPGNIIVNTRQVKLADFGLAASYQSTMMSGCTLTGESGGSIEYMAPEQLLEFHEAKPTNDLFSVGATLYRLLSGRLPYEFPAQFSQRVRTLLQSNPIPLRRRNRKLPDGLGAIVDRCLARDPGDRWQSAKELYDALQPFASKERSQTVSVDRSGRGLKADRTTRPSLPSGTNEHVAPSRSGKSKADAAGRVAKQTCSGSDFDSSLWRIQTSRTDVPPSRRPPPHTAQVVPLANGHYAAALDRELLVFDACGEFTHRHRCQAPILGRPAVLRSGAVVVHDGNGLVECIDDSGDRRWQTQSSEPLGWAVPLVDDRDRIWICLSGGGVGLVETDGTAPRRPFYRSMVRFDSTGLIEGETLWLGGEDGRVHAIALDGSRGANRWREPEDRGRCRWYINGSLLKRGDDEILAKSGDGFLQGFSSEGQPRWRWECPGVALADPVVDRQGLVYQAYSMQKGTARGGGVACFDPQRDVERWSVTLESGVESTPVMDERGTLFVADVVGGIHAISADGQILSHRAVGSGVRSRLSLSDDGGLLFVITAEAEIVALATRR